MLDTALIRLIAFVNRGRIRGRAGAAIRAGAWILEVFFGASNRLAVYGSLAPGRENHHVLADLNGEWSRGSVRGRKAELGWGASLGYPALRWDPEGEPLKVWVLTAKELRSRWAELDRFEGPEYVRSLIPVYEGSRLLCIASIYLAR